MILSGLMFTKPCKALPRNCFSRGVFLANNKGLHLQPPNALSGFTTEQAGSLLDSLGLPADLGLYWVCVPLSTMLRNSGILIPVTCILRENTFTWMMPVSGGSLIPVVTQTELQEQWTQGHVIPFQSPKGMNQSGANPVYCWVPAMVSPVCDPVSIPGDCHRLWGAAELCRELMDHGAFSLVSADVLLASGWQEVPHNELP